MRPAPDDEGDFRGAGRLTGKVAVVTGGDSGIGRAVSIAFAREGADVVIAYLQEDGDAEETKRKVEKHGRSATLIRGDLGDDAHCRRVVEQAVGRHGRIDCLINNAGWQGKAVERFEDMDAERVERTFRSNVLSMFHLTRHALPHMRAGATIVNTASIQASQPSPMILDYATTKGAIVTFTKGLAEALGPRGIRVNAIAPGPIWTPLVVQSFDAEKIQEFGANTPLGRAGQPAEVAMCFVFLASDESRYVSGAVLAVTGGKQL
jgi:NAD(P)-dependent dehydrogenase (short-subunit alcohol dehydrogenase family)